MYFDENFPNFRKNPHEDVANWLECPKYSGKATTNVAIWLKYCHFVLNSRVFGKIDWICQHLARIPDFSENSIEFADILPTVSLFLG